MNMSCEIQAKCKTTTPDAVAFTSNLRYLGDDNHHLDRRVVNRDILCANLHLPVRKLQKSRSISNGFTQGQESPPSQGEIFKISALLKLVRPLLEHPHDSYSYFDSVVKNGCASACKNRLLDLPEDIKDHIMMYLVEDYLARMKDVHSNILKIKHTYECEIPYAVSSYLPLMRGHVIDYSESDSVRGVHKLPISDCYDILSVGHVVRDDDKSLTLTSYMNVNVTGMLNKQSCPLFGCGEIELYVAQTEGVSLLDYILGIHRHIR